MGSTLQLFDDVIKELEATLLRRIPHPSSTVRLALATMLRGQGAPVRAATVNAVVGSHPAAPLLGAALELMNTSLHTLHEGLDRSTRQPFSLSMAGDILAGDYLSSAAFRLLVEVGSLPVMAMVSGAVQRACESEILDLEHHESDRNNTDGRSHTGYLRAAALGEAAGLTAAQLAGLDGEAARLAGNFGRFMAIHARCVAPVDSEAGSSSSAAHRLLVEGALREAENAATEFAHRTGNHGPSMLVGGSSVRAWRR